MDGILITFSKNLREIMHKRGDNITSLAEALNLPFSTVANWYHGRKMPRAGNIEALADHYNVNNDYLITDHSKKEETQKETTHLYNFFEAGLSAGMLSVVDPFTTNEVKKIALPDETLGHYAGDSEIFLTLINGESMNRVIPNHSLIAIKKYSSVYDLREGDIVAFRDSGEMCVKRFYNDKHSKNFVFMPDSIDTSYRPYIYSWEDSESLEVIGRVIACITHF